MLSILDIIIQVLALMTITNWFEYQFVILFDEPFNSNIATLKMQNKSTKLIEIHQKDFLLTGADALNVFKITNVEIQSFKKMLEASVCQALKRETTNV